MKFMILGATVFSAGFFFTSVSQAKNNDSELLREIQTQAVVMKEKKSGDPEVTKIKGSMEYVVCTSAGSLAVRSEDLEDVLFRAQRFEPVKLFQGWNKNKKKKKISGTVYSFVKAQFPKHADEDESSGWVADAFIKPKSECPGAGGGQGSDGDDQGSNNGSNGNSGKGQGKPDTGDKAGSKGENKGGNGSGDSTSTAGLSDPNCCKFPLNSSPDRSFETGMARFGAGRSGGDRLHAACDLYQEKNTPILAVAPGKVIRGLYYFYQSTYAIEVKHSGGFVVRYGEITGRQASGASEDSRVSTGQQVGSMGKVDSGCCDPMLHFELYSGSKSGSLTQGGNDYQRRSDLLNPTKYLLNWQR